MDAKVRQGLRNWLRRLQQELRITTVLVTHDQEVAMEVADRIVVMNQARIEQVKPPVDVFHAPSTEFVMDFLGNVNLFQGRVEQDQVRIIGKTFALVEPRSEQPSSANVDVRPHEWEISREANGVPSLVAQVLRINPAGPLVRVFLTVDGGIEIKVDMTFEEMQALGISTGDTVPIAPRQTRVFY